MRCEYQTAELSLTYSKVNTIMARICTMNDASAKKSTNDGNLCQLRSLRCWSATKPHRKSIELLGTCTAAQGLLETSWLLMHLQSIPGRAEADKYCRNLLEEESFRNPSGTPVSKEDTKRKQ